MEVALLNPTCQSETDLLVLLAIQIQSLARFLQAEYNSFGTEDNKSKRLSMLIFELNRSGKYLQIQSQLRVHLEKIIREKYKTKG